MTRKEAIICLKGIKNIGHDMLTEQKDFQESLDIAIKALEKEPCEDCISRQAMLAIAGDSCLDLDSYDDTREFCDEIKELPSVTPQPKPSIDRVCDILAEMFETPCNYRFNEIDIDDFMSEDVYCENHCSDGCYGECWKRFFEKYDKFSKESE